MDADRKCHGKGEKQQDLDGYDYSETLCTGMCHLGGPFLTL